MNRTTLVHAVIAATAAILTPIAAFGQTERRETVQLTLADAVRRAVDHNPDLTIVRLATGVEAARVGQSRGAYAPMFSTTAGRSRSVTPPTNSLLGDAGVELSDWFGSAGIRQRLVRGGGVWSLSWDTARTTTNSPIRSFDPNLQSGIQLAFSQPLLRDRTIDAARLQYVIATRNRGSSELQLRESVVQTIAAVKQAYWALKATLANIGVQQRSLELAQELARQNKVRVDAGQIPPLDLVQAEAEVAERRESLIRARTTAEDAEDRLRRLIMDPADASFWNVSLDPIDAPVPLMALPDVDAAIAAALANRYDLARAGHDLQNATTTVEFLNNQKLPDVRLEASYRGSGLGGTELVRAGGFPGIVTGARNRSFSDALGQTFAADYPTWSVGITVNYPLGRSAEAASVARAEIERRQGSERIASLRLEAIAEVRRAARQVRGTAERVDAARAAAALAEERLADEQRRYDVGLSTTFLVTQAQRDLLQAQVNLLQTTLDHQSAMVSFDAVQEAPRAGAGSTPGLRGADIVPVTLPTPRGIFRTGAGQ